ncbi:hypothetical protein JMJ35_009395 [Cladonia borealis]|uniref:Uncharacterized protein n=1 Tax=Cladonia borealis TaxID=184061 RepID=A0AA39QUW7_9LECA|nr:hypothetical protein JMJ35_009395 [Cladonia borealis]
MAPVGLPDEGSFALNAFGKQSPSTEWRTERQNNILIFCVFLVACYSYLVYSVNKGWREAELRCQAKQRTDTEQREPAADSVNITKTAVPVNRTKANHPLYGSLTATELPRPREEAVMINPAAGTSVAGRTQDVRSSLVQVTTKPVRTRPAELSHPRTDHAARPEVTSHQGSTRSLRSSELMIPYGTFEGLFHEIAPTKTKKKVTFAEDERSSSSWSTLVSGDFEA